MPTPTTPPGVGNTLIRLADIPLADRMKAIHNLMQHGGGLTPEEAQQLLAIAIDPEDTSARIAA